MRRSIKQFIKRTMQHGAARLGRHTRAHREPQLVILMYHRVIPADDVRSLIEEPGMMVTPQTLQMHLQTVNQYFEVTQISEWITRKSLNQPLPGRSCAVTFDDGWADNYEFAFPILREMNIPATIYLTSDLIGSERLFWPERLARIVTEIARNHSSSWDSECLQWLTHANTSYNFSDRPPSGDELAELIAHAKLNTDQENHLLIDNIEMTLSLISTIHQPSLLNWQQIDAMLQSGLIEFGSHTCNHTRLNEDTPDDVIIKEITNSKRQIEQHTGKAVNSFCFPNGDYSPFSLELVKQQYKSALTTKPGWNTIDTDHYLLKRIAIHEGNSYDDVAFKARISGWL